MERCFLPQTELEGFLASLRSFGDLHGPVVSETGVARFDPLDGDTLRLDYGRTLIPPKKYLFPFREEILLLKEGRYRQAEPVASPLILFGVHPCDLAGLAYLDRVFLAAPPDPTYAARRARLTLIGVSCTPDDYCFCSESPAYAPCDLFLTQVEGGYLLTPGSARGGELMAAAGGLLREDAPPPSPSPAEFAGVPPADPELRLSDHPLWARFAQSCLSCGACSVCCPTCYCFDLREYPGLSGGVRRREWDNCLFASHGEVAGANFRETRLERLRYRFLHKYCGFSPLQGVASCVGCGRCRAACPVEIDLRELLPAPKETP